jgi:ABC-type Co2+ transport system permease subunit
VNSNLWLGGAAVAYGLYTLYARTTSHNYSRKLEAMKQRWGERRGTIVHVVGYTVMPIVFGLALIASALLGRAGPR